MIILLVHKPFVLTLSQDIEPYTYSQAVKIPCCKEAMDTEIKALEANKLGILLLSPLVSIALVVNGYIRSRDEQMALLKDTKSGWLLKDIPNSPELIS